LRAFLHVVRLGGIGKAATALGLTQPAVTARIRNLEATIGAELFLRTGSGMKLTKRGELLLNYAERFEQLSGLMQRDVVDPAGVEGRLRLGVSETIAQSWLPDLIFRLHERFPRLEIEFNVDISINLRDLLLERQIDLAVLLGPISEYSVENTDLPGFDLAWYRSARAEDCADASDYLRRPVLTYARQTRPYRELKQALFERVGPTASIFPSSSLSACFRLVAADLGVAALPIALARDFVREGSIRRFDPGWTPNPLHFTASFLAEPYSPTIEAAAALAREAADDHKINFSDG
jgi:DNA-binding transcriptional LysR family regulator